MKSDLYNKPPLQSIQVTAVGDLRSVDVTGPSLQTDLLKETTIENNWERIKEAIVPCRKVLGGNKHHYNEWISIETLAKIQEENKETANKQAMNSIKADKQKYMGKLAQTVEKVAIEVNVIQLSDTTNKQTGRYYKPERPVKDKKDKPITEAQEQRNRWVNTGKLLNESTPLNRTADRLIPMEARNTARMQLDYSDFADDLALLSHTHEQMQMKTTSVAAASAALGLNIHKGRNKILKYNTEYTDSITFDGEALEEVGTFMYLGSSING
ncbi:unnamed protein product [Schistosoma margrebowiei]|uniref:Uncharacterized protein n=1 Tax=Schistosoma margrebowiei TaxID=48269 RepID=A0A183M8R5_9TREM|nr:unnamed protein product [Schistosoma margrebowiei]